MLDYLKSVWDAFLQYLGELVSAVYQFLEGLARWLLNAVLDLVLKVARWVLDAIWDLLGQGVQNALVFLAEWFAEFPRPAWYAAAENAVCNNWDMLGVVSGLNIVGPLQLVLVALVARFLIRRLPFVG
jgi:hypothetical protein